jgi:hypothetical protein
MKLPRRPPVLPILAAAVLTAAAPAARATTSEPWQPDPIFQIDPAQVPGPAAGASKAVYRLLDSQGLQVGPAIERPVTDLLDWFEVPDLPGAYRLEGRLENALGEVIHQSSASLYFDDAPPPPPDPQGPGRWLLATEPAVLRIGHPSPPLPVSGVRGYAISIDRGSGGAPCDSVCASDEVDLAGGIDDDSISLGTLPEGTTYARVVAVSGAGVPSPIRTVAFDVDATPPAVTVSGLPQEWSGGPVRLTAHASDERSGMAASGPIGPFTALAVDSAAPTAAPGDTATAWVTGSGIHRVTAFARDAAGNMSGGVDAGPAPSTAAVRIDEDPPVVRFAARQDPTEPERIEATVEDALSGPSATRGSIGLRPAGGKGALQRLPTRVEKGRLVANWDSDAFPPGKYEFLATGYDLAGNAATGGSRARGGRMILVNPLKTPTSLEAVLGGGRARSGHAVSGPTIRFEGRLRTAAGSPGAGQQIAVTETFAGGSEPASRTTVVPTRADGSFALRLAPGPSRDIVAAFAGDRLLTRAASRSVRLQVRTRARLHASAAVARVGGAPIVFSGAVVRAGARQAVAGLPVELQFRYPGAGWSEFRTVEADAHGRFRYSYRFSDDDSRGVRFGFRAYVPGRKGWPYGPGASRPVSVTGR